MQIVIAGAYAIGTHLAKLLARANEDITLIDTDEERLNNIGTDADLLTMLASPTSVKALREAGAATADLFIAVTPDESLNMTACVLAKALGAKKTVAKIDNAEYIEPEQQEFFARLGISSLIYPELLAGKDINNGLKMSWVRQRWDVHNGALVMLGIKLREGCEILNQPLKDLCGPDDPYHVVAIKRGTDTIIPGGNDSLQLYDLAYFMTTKQYIPYIRKIVGKEHYVDVKNVMIMGGGATAVRAVKTMPEYMDVKIIETDPERCEELSVLLPKAEILCGDGTNEAFLRECGIETTGAVAALTGIDEENVLIGMYIRKTWPKVKVITKVNRTSFQSIIDSMDLGSVFNPRNSASNLICRYVRAMQNSGSSSQIETLYKLVGGKAEALEFRVSESSKLCGVPLQELKLRENLLIGCIGRGGQIIIPSGQDAIEPGDSVIVVTCSAGLGRLEDILARGPGHE